MKNYYYFKIGFLLFVVANATAQVKDSTYIKQLIDSALKIEFEDNKLAQKIANEALSLSEKKGYSILNSRSLIILGYLQDDIGNFSVAKTYYERSLALNLKNNSKKQIALDYSNLGLNSENSGDLLVAIDWHSKALQMREEIKDTFGISASNNNIGNIYGRQGDNSKALSYFLKSLSIIEQMGNDQKLPPHLNNIAIIYFHLNNYEKALEYYSRALDIWKKNGNKEGIAIVSSNILKVYSAYKEYDKAMLYANEALRIYIELDNKQGIAEGYNSIGSIYSEIKNYSKALDYFQKCLFIKLEMNDKSEIAVTYSNLASLYLETKQIDKAISNLDLALPLAIDNRLLRQQKDIYKYYFLAYKAKNKYELALKYHELYFAINDSVYNIESTKQLNELNTRYETDKKAKENKLLQIENELSGKAIKQQKLVTNFIIGGLLIVSLLAFFIFKGLKAQKKANVIISKQKEEVHKQKAIIEEHQKETIDSINYAKKIQYALLAQEDLLKINLSNYFIMFNPKDIVSGDFYWATEHNHKFYLAVCDSTGHGVPGAFMSLLNMGFLSEAIKERNIEQPHEIFNYVRQRLINSISSEQQKDGMDGILMCIDRITNQITYSAANNEPILISNNQVIELPKNKMPVGKGEKSDSFTLFQLNAKTGDMLFLYTDGFADQFGGPKGKKFKYKQLNELLLNVRNNSTNEQKLELISVFENWKGELEQVDDVLLVGIRI